jgi:predicted dinucleotide-binding enzyme
MIAVLGGGAMGAALAVRWAMAGAEVLCSGRISTHRSSLRFVTAVRILRSG